jgi:hypothetical protein
LKTKVHKKIRDYATSQYAKLNNKEFILGDMPYNFRCHMNSVQKVKEGKAKKVLMCFIIDRSDNSQCIHFINQLVDGKYQDNTLGWLYEQTDYYLIKEISPDEQEHVWDSLQDIRKALVEINGSWADKNIFKSKIQKCL